MKLETIIIISALFLTLAPIANGQLLGLETATVTSSYNSENSASKDSYIPIEGESEKVHTSVTTGEDGTKVVRLIVPLAIQEKYTSRSLYETMYVLAANPTAFSTPGIPKVGEDRSKPYAKRVASRGRYIVTPASATSNLAIERMWDRESGEAKDKYEFKASFTVEKSDSFGYADVKPIEFKER